LTPQIEEYIKDCKVLKATVDYEKRVMHLTLYFLSLVPYAVLSLIIENLAGFYSLSDVLLEVKYPKELLCAETADAVVHDILSDSPTIKRMIIGVKYGDDGKIILTLDEAYASLSKDKKIDKKIRACVLSMFDRETDVIIELKKKRY
jgi:hypothetical protein